MDGYLAPIGAGFAGERPRNSEKYQVMQYLEEWHELFGNQH